MVRGESFCVQLDDLEDRIAKVYQEAGSLDCVNARALASDSLNIWEDIVSLRNNVNRNLCTIPVSPIRKSTKLALAHAAREALKRANEE